MPRAALGPITASTIEGATITTKSERHHPKCASAAAVVLVLFAAAGCTGGPEDAETSPPSENSKNATSEKPTQPAEADESALDGVSFTDPEGRYMLTVPADWEPHHDVAGEGIEVWLVAEADANFAPNVNVMTEDFTGISLADYLELSITNAPNIVPDFELLSSDLVTGAAGQELAVMESSGSGLNYLGVIGIGPAGSVIVTLTAPPDRYTTIRDALLPYLLTLQPT